MTAGPEQARQAEHHRDRDDDGWRNRAAEPQRPELEGRRGARRVERERAAQVVLGLVGASERDQLLREADVDLRDAEVGRQGAPVEDLGLLVLAEGAVQDPERGVRVRHRVLGVERAVVERVQLVPPIWAKRNPSRAARKCGSISSYSLAAAVPMTA